ncbi:MAG: type II secretion system protein GspJ [Paracoccaceae bacterium]
MTRGPDAGVTLIEMMVALAIFALIGIAGFTMLDQVLRSQRGTEGRLERLSEQQRALHVVLSDFSMAEPRSLQATDSTVEFTRSRSADPLPLRYHLNADTLYRTVGTIADQPILSGVASLDWRFLTPTGTWSDTWPTDTTLTTPRNPRAVELVVTLQGTAGQLRRVAPLPLDLE